MTRVNASSSSSSSIIIIAEAKLSSSSAAKEGKGKEKINGKRSMDYNLSQLELESAETLVKFKEIHSKIQSKFLNCYSCSPAATTVSSWGVRRRRSVLDNPPTPSPPSKPVLKLPCPPSISRTPIIIPASVAEEITSPVSPLALSSHPVDCDDRSKNLPQPLLQEGRRLEKSKRFSKTKRENLKKDEIELTNQRDLLKESIENRKRQFQELASENSILKARKEELLLSYAGVEESEMGKDGERRQQQQQQKKKKKKRTPELETCGEKVLNNHHYSKFTQLPPESSIPPCSTPALHQQQELVRHSHPQQQFYQLLQSPVQHQQKQEILFYKSNQTVQKELSSERTEGDQNRRKRVAVIDLNLLPAEQEEVTDSCEKSGYVGLCRPTDLCSGMYFVHSKTIQKAMRQQRMQRNKEKKMVLAASYRTKYVMN